MEGLLDKAKTYVAEKMAEMKKPEATVTDVDLKDVSRECITYDAKVSVTNPYSVSIPICDISYTLKCANRFLSDPLIMFLPSFLFTIIFNLSIHKKVY